MFNVHGGKHDCRGFELVFQLIHGFAQRGRVGPIDARSRTIKNHGQKFTLRLLQRLANTTNITVMCHCAEDQQQCHRHELRKLILGRSA